ncbi:hypothetical protein ACIPCB_00835 [Pediococcus pentosaceus]|uniref:hypothetical protein n=1 Tax=Pediococcus pentosaceus TaxID=1255 RepID=UPI0019115630|nr:hypothetical protein [Pediococcus pentosaceus]MCV3324915.1 hypothetical protein [Pediococcus pentosaceus]
MNANKKRISPYVILISCAAALGGLLFGYDTAVISGAVGFLQIKFTFHNDLHQVPDDILAFPISK